MVVLVLVLVVLLAAAVVALAYESREQRRTIEQAERRIAALELDGAATLVIEPGTESAPRPPNALVN